MFNISDYLKKFQNLTTHEGEVKTVVCDVLTHYNILLKKEDVSFRQKQVFISAHPLVKNEIHLYKKDILKRINERTSCVVRDIR